MLKNYETLDLVADDAATAQKWLTGLRHMQTELAEADMATKLDMYPSCQLVISAHITVVIYHNQSVKELVNLCFLLTINQWKYFIISIGK